jgi:hypothetical protein
MSILHAPSRRTKLEFFSSILESRVGVSRSCSSAAIRTLLPAGCYWITTMMSRIHVQLMFPGLLTVCKNMY